jgi:hypothetical protein
VEDMGQQQQAILHKLDLMDKKFEAVYREIYDINIIVKDPKDANINLFEVVEHALEFEGTPSNNILSDEYIEEKEET